MQAAAAARRLVDAVRVCVCEARQRAAARLVVREARAQRRHLRGRPRVAHTHGLTSMAALNSARARSLQMLGSGCRCWQPSSSRTQHKNACARDGHRTD
eukprot:4736738-Pleurochrysis_carterae.AAC.1